MLLERVIVAVTPEVSLRGARKVMGLVREIPKRGKQLPLLDNTFVVELDPAEIKALKAQGFRVVPDDLVGVPPVPSIPIKPAGGDKYPTTELDPALTAPMTQMVDCEVEAAHERFSGAGINVGIVDTGVWAEHPDLDGAIQNWKDFVDEEPKPCDPNGHGTACAGMVVGNGSIVSKFHGTAPGAYCSVARVLGANGFGYSSRVIEGLGWLADQGVDVVSVSLGSPKMAYTPLSRALDVLVERGIVVVTSGGNHGPAQIGQPANAYGAITCAACDWNGEYCDFSAVGPAAGVDGVEFAKPDVIAWGRNVALLRALGTSMGSVINDYYVAAAGTSFSTPFVAGLAALYLEAASNSDDFKTAIMSSAVDNPAYTPHQEGRGAVRIVTAIDRNYTPTPLPKPPPWSSCPCMWMGLGWGTP